GLLLGGVLLAARIAGVFLSLLGSGLTKQQRNVVPVSLPRGMAAGALATLPVTKGVPGDEGLPVIVCSAGIMSILIVAGGFYLAKRQMVPAAEGEGEVPLPAGAARPSGNYRPVQPPPMEVPLSPISPAAGSSAAAAAIPPGVLPPRTPGGTLPL